jgi:hypothetical protein
MKLVGTAAVCEWNITLFPVTVAQSLTNNGTTMINLMDTLEKRSRSTSPEKFWLPPVIYNQNDNLFSPELLLPFLREPSKIRAFTSF